LIKKDIKALFQDGINRKVKKKNLEGLLRQEKVLFAVITR